MTRDLKHFQRRNPSIEAVEFDSDTWSIADYEMTGVIYDPVERQYQVETRNGVVFVADGDFLIKEPDGSGFYPCKPNMFHQLYVEVP